VEQIAKELIELKRQKDEIDGLFTTKRDEMFNALVNSGASFFDYEGWRFQKTEQSVSETITKERLYAAMIDAGLSTELRAQIILAASRESVRAPSIRMIHI
jgi:hypothetical protein